MKEINFKLLNFLIGVGIVFILWLMRDLWIGILSKIFAILLPFIISFAIAYILYPLLRKLQSKGVPKTVALSIIFILSISFIGFILWLLIPNLLPKLFDQSQSLFYALIVFVQDVSSKYNVNLISLKDAIDNVSSYITTNLGRSLSTGFINIINQSINMLSKSIIVFIVTFYFLADMEKIRRGFRLFLEHRRTKKTLKYVRTLDNAINHYVNAFALYALIIFVEYTAVFYLIGHPNYLLLGLLAAVGSVIPYFGGIITNIIAIVTASVISSQLLILTIIVSLIFPNIDGYFTSPKIFKHSNQVPALLSIFAVFTGGVLYGVQGIMLALPITIIIMTTVKFYHNEISEGIEKIKEKAKE